MWKKISALEWAEKHLVNNSVFNLSINAPIIFTRQGIKHAISSRIYPNKVILIYDLLSLAKKAVLIDVLPDRKGRPEVKKILKLFAEWYFDGKIHMVILIVRQMNNGNFYYDHEVIKEKKL
jgi:hypothetical protein